MGLVVVSPLDTWLTTPGLVIVYDGECPFCSAYIRLLRLKDAAGPVTLVDARQRADVTADMSRRGLDINQTMLAIYGGRLHPGNEAITLLSALSTSSGVFNRAMARLFASPKRSRLLYPALRAGRNLALRVMGRQPIP
jgi:predicted DCC family thiol-disulfide oxidoreductase YuxK